MGCPKQAEPGELWCGLSAVPTATDHGPQVTGTAWLTVIITEFQVEEKTSVSLFLR